MSAALIKEIMSLTVGERLQLVEEIWDTISPDQLLPLSDAMRAELDSRLASHTANPDAGIDWDSLRRRLTDSR